MTRRMVMSYLLPLKFISVHWIMTMKFKSFLLAGALAMVSATATFAATYQYGDVTDGVTFSKKLQKKSVDFIEFSLDAPDGFFVSALNISVTSKTGKNLSEVIGLYSNSGLIATAAAKHGGGNTATLSFSGANTPGDGSYTLGVAGWKAFFPDDMKDASSTAFFGNGKYTVQIDPTISAVPLPAGGLLLLTGLGALAFGRRKTRKA